MCWSCHLQRYLRDMDVVLTAMVSGGFGCARLMAGFDYLQGLSQQK